MPERRRQAISRSALLSRFYMTKKTHQTYTQLLAAPQRLGDQMAISVKVVEDYFSILEDLLIALRLPPPTGLEIVGPISSLCSNLH